MPIPIQGKNSHLLVIQLRATWCKVETCFFKHSSLPPWSARGMASLIIDIQVSHSLTLLHILTILIAIVEFYHFSMVLQESHFILMQTERHG